MPNYYDTDIEIGSVNCSICMQSYLQNQINREGKTKMLLRRLQTSKHFCMLLLHEGGKIGAKSFRSSDFNYSHDIPNRAVRLLLIFISLKSSNPLVVPIKRTYTNFSTVVPSNNKVKSIHIDIDRPISNNPKVT